MAAQPYHEVERDLGVLVDAELKFNEAIKEHLPTGNFCDKKRMRICLAA
jgi:hypothetical protein